MTRGTNCIKSSWDPIFDKRKHAVRLPSTFLHELVTEEVSVTFLPHPLSRFQDGAFRCQRETELLDQRVEEMVLKQ
jgi:ubiquinone biosynthesis protein UbiJ